MHTAKQRKAFEIVQSTGKPVKHAMLEAGYSLHSAHKPQELTNSASWRNMLEKKLPNEYVLKRHKYLLERKDGASVAKGLDMVYKLKKFYVDDETQKGNIQVQIINYATKILEAQEAGDTDKAKQIAENARVEIVNGLGSGDAKPKNEFVESETIT